MTMMNEEPPDFRDREININLAGYIRDEIGTIDYGTVRTALTTDPRYRVRHIFYEGFCTYCRSKGVPQYKIISELMAIRQISGTYDLTSRKMRLDGRPNIVNVFSLPSNIRIGDLDPDIRIGDLDGDR